MVQKSDFNEPNQRELVTKQPMMTAS
jgi:hypothetical protein